MSLSANYDILQHLHWKGMMSYARATDDKDVNLPFIRPLSYHTSLHWMHKQFSVMGSIKGDLTQENYSPEYGEDRTPAYLTLDVSTDYTLKVHNYNAVVQVGVENLTNEYYSTYADWGNIPRMGRNLFTSLKINF